MLLVYFNIIMAFLAGAIVFDISPELWLVTIVISLVIAVVNDSLTSRKQKQKTAVATKRQTPRA
mgnify:CR=1 FL=1